jgi:transposase, IS30 family
LRDRWSYRAIAAGLGVAASTVSREIGAHAIEGTYRARDAQRAAVRARRRSGNPKLVRGSRLWDLVVEGFNDKRSPEQISGRLRRDFPGEDDMQVSPETIYQALYVQAAGALRHELAVEQALRQGRTSRRPRSKLGPRSNRSWIGEASISNRPAEAADRAIPGHWEGDLVIGTEGRSALITLVERKSRFLLISRIDVHDTTTVTSRLTQMAESLPARFATITWDQGVEMAGHARFTIATGCPVYFADPHSPWQRPTNENSNGLIRDYYPKNTDFSLVPDADIAAMQDQLNRRPRKVLDYATPAETLHSQLVLR